MSIALLKGNCTIGNMRGARCTRGQAVVSILEHLLSKRLTLGHA